MLVRYDGPQMNQTLVPAIASHTPAGIKNWSLIQNLWDFFFFNRDRISLQEPQHTPSSNLCSQRNAVSSDSYWINAKIIMPITKCIIRGNLNVHSLIYQKAMEATTGAPRRKIFSTTALHNLLLIVSRMSLQRSIRLQLCSTILNPIWPYDKSLQDK